MSSGILFAFGRSGLFEIYEHAPDGAEDDLGGDVKLFYGIECFDVVVDGGDFIRDPGLETSILLSLFTNKRAEATDVLPDNSVDRYGWCLDDRLGSKLWLLGREKTIPETLTMAKFYAEDCLQWLIEDSVASSIIVVATRIRYDTIQLSIEIIRQNNISEFYKYYYNWQNQLYGRI
jgi:phage gp46-like protein